METSIDLYSEDYADDYIEIDDNEDENQEQLDENQEHIENQEQSGHLENGDDEVNESKEDDSEQKKTVKPKRIIRNPRPKLDVEALKSHKGLLSLENCFKKKKYRGRGHEEEDLRTIMKTYEYWCHRLFPKSPFDECIQKLEKLGTKKNVQTYIKRIRMDLIFDDEEPVRIDNEEDLEQDANSDQFDNLSPSGEDNEMPTLTEEQLERIRINREKANQLRLEKLQRAKERAQASLSQNSFEDLNINSIQTHSVTSQNENLIIIEDTELKGQTESASLVAIDSDLNTNSIQTPRGASQNENLIIIEDTELKGQTESVSKVAVDSDNDSRTNALAVDQIIEEEDRELEETEVL